MVEKEQADVSASGLSLAKTAQREAVGFFATDNLGRVASAGSGCTPKTAYRAFAVQELGCSFSSFMS